MAKRYQAQVVRAMVGNQYVEGYQVYVDRIETAANGVTVLSTATERIPADRGIPEGEAVVLLEKVRTKLVYEEGRFSL